MERIEIDQVSNQESNYSIWYGLKIAASDYRVWVVAFILCSNHTAYGFNNFSPTITKGFNLGNRTTTLLLTAPPYLLGAIISFCVAYSSGRNKERGWHIAGSMSIAAIGFIISVATLHNGAGYFASFLQTPEKRACAMAIINVVGQFGNIWTPYFFLPSDSPRYLQAMLLMMSFSILGVVGCMVMKLILKRDNQKLVKAFEGAGTTPVLYTLQGTMRG
ncbi:hypothetical protein IFR05_015436 [Cadophora sp. M221]|nr:hypothetical protein IFR05_015436 [Cadophora sp. M221]